MNTARFQILKNQLIKSSDQNHCSIIELCITELSSGNFPKAIDLSEELIKKDINDSAGWALKALSQVNLFDYEQNLFLLKSSLASIEEFKNKSTLTKQEIIAIESIFETTMLERTNALVLNNIEDFISVRNKAMEEKNKAKVAAIAAVISGAMGSLNDSEIGKMIGYGGFAAGLAANSYLNDNAKKLTKISKGAFGMAVLNISFSLTIGLNLKDNLNNLDKAFYEEAVKVLENWIETLGFLYVQVIENMIIYCSELKKSKKDKTYYLNLIRLVKSPEVEQFFYLSKITGMENTFPEIDEIKELVDSLDNVTEDELKSSLKENYILMFSPLVIGLIMLGSGSDSGTGGLSSIGIIGGIVFFLGIFISAFLAQHPKGKLSEINNFLKTLLNVLIKLKSKSKTIIIQNLVPDNSLQTPQIKK